MAVKKGEIKKKAMSKSELEQALIENFIALQRVMTNLSVKFDSLAENISKLLNLFEISAKTFVETQGKVESVVNKELAEKIDILLEQNKIIAKGITLVEEAVRERPYQASQQSQFPQPQQFPRF